MCFYEFELALCNKDLNLIGGPYCYKKTTLYNAWIAGDVGFFELVGSVMRLLLAMAIFVIELPMRIVLGGLRRVIEGLGWLAVSFVELFD